VEAMTMATRIAVLKDGILQQVDTPQVLYEHPANLFVAGFIGSPSMNFFDATVVEADGKYVIDGGSFRVRVPDDLSDKVRPYKGRQVIFGIRPENIHAKEYTPPGVKGADMTAKVDVTELMGNEIFVYMVTGKTQFIARVDPRAHAVVGQDMTVVLDMERMHLFDPKTEKAFF
jgi:multiple sugar transport system ATP-binding protein